MAIEIKVGKEATEQEEPKPVISQVDLNMRKTLDGDLMIFDHADIDIVVMPKKSKIVAFAKDVMSEVVYGAQDRLFKFLVRKGIVKPDSVVGGSVYGSIEGAILPSEELKPVNLAIVNLSKWIESERPYFEFIEEYEDMHADRLTDPDDEESTELGEVPHEETKGTLRPGYNYGPYWQSYTYE
tara:strand:+ start:822 stop:1370 length:549 start_codon:yes stop_codon:yes gene_type:complete